MPTLEEYAHILGIPVSDKVPFSGLEEVPRSHLIGEALHLKKYEIEAHWVKKGGLFGLPSDFLIRKLLPLLKPVVWMLLKPSLCCSSMVWLCSLTLTVLLMLLLDWESCTYSVG